MRKLMILSVAALLAGCATTGVPVASQAEIQADHARQAALEAEWARNNAHADEQMKLHQEAVAKWQAKLRAEEADPAYQERERLSRAAELECRMQGQMAAAAAANPRYLVDIYSAASGAQVYQTCMQMQAARMGY